MVVLAGQIQQNTQVKKDRDAFDGAVQGMGNQLLNDSTCNPLGGSWPRRSAAGEAESLSL